MKDFVQHFCLFVLHFAGAAAYNQSIHPSIKQMYTSISSFNFNKTVLNILLFDFIVFKLNEVFTYQL